MKKRSKKSRKVTEDLEQISRLAKSVDSIKRRSRIKSLKDYNNEKIHQEQNCITPKKVMFDLLQKVYGNQIDKKRFEIFQVSLLRNLSLLATNGKLQEIFSDDFDGFFKMVISTLNLVGKMREILQENGIDFDIQKFLDDLYGGGGSQQ